MKILVLNSGSSSIKYQLFAMPEAQVIAKGLVERIGEADGALHQETPDGSKTTLRENYPDHGAGLRRVVQVLTEGDAAPLGDVAEIGAVGHRVVHGGAHFAETALVDEAVLEAIEHAVALAPLHNPPALLGLKIARELFSQVPHVVVVDTAFHQTMPPRAYHYALPKEFFDDLAIRRYGAHGTSHRYVAAQAAAALGKSADAVNLITCHLGNGSSMAAIEAGRCIDTSMGLTPLEGLVMGTRTGDIDPAVIFTIARQKGMSIDEIDALMNKKSGLLGLSGKSNDVRKLVELREQGDADAALALDVFCYRIKKYIGAYSAALGRVDAVVFTAGIGENSAFVRHQVCEGLKEALGVALDDEKNAAAQGQCDISAPDARVKVLVVPTNEEKLIAMDTFEVAGGRKPTAVKNVSA